MKMTKVTCPACDGKIDMDIEGKKHIFCPYCGTQLTIDNEEFVVTQNINIHTTHTDEVALEIARLEDQRKKREEIINLIAGIVGFIILMALALYLAFFV